MRKQAFTLIELLVVVLIIGILSAIALPQYERAVEKSRAVQAVTMVRSLANAVERYYLANGAYPKNDTGKTEHIEILNNLGLDIEAPTLQGFRYHTFFESAGLGYIAVWREGSCYYGISQSTALEQDPGVLKCYVGNSDAEKNASSCGAKVCKSLCGNSTWRIVWGSGQYGCIIN